MSEVEDVVRRWHAAVNSGDPARAAAAVSDPVTVLGPRGAGPIGRAEFGDWVTRSGITLTPRSWHPTGDGVVVVEQDAVWAGGGEPAVVASVFRVTGDLVSAVARYPDLASALANAR
jgi:ketosteroid isomerase-like protein